MSEHQFTTTNQFTSKVYRDVYPRVDPTSSLLSQAGKVVLITGASKGLGKDGFAKAFAKAGAKAIIIASRKVEDLKGTAEAIKNINSNIEVLALPLEITKEESVKKFFDNVKAHYRTVDVLVNNAGVFKSADNTIRDGQVDLWWGDIETNLKGQYLVTKYFLNFIGTEYKATIVHLTSMVAALSVPGTSGYSIAKLGNVQLNAITAVENPNVTAISLHPGIVLTAMHDDITSFRTFARDTPELAGAVGVWLASEQAKFLNGRYMSVNWAVDELVARKDEIVKDNLLTINFTGKFGDAELVG